MTKINILSPFVADLIAAGEVVERPAAVIKELMENSIDAGARNITVEIRGGGAEYIRVTDDGSGMAPEDAGIAFMRHATSKLRDERGLEAIGTLGFRGEALAAVGSVSHVELNTRERGADSGTRLLLEGGEIMEMHEAGCPDGTTIIIRGLFYNTPARLKFMKTDRAEGSACVQAALRCALGRPEVSVRCIKDNKEEFFTPGDGRAESAIYSLLGRELAAAMLPVSLEDDAPVKVKGFISAPSAGRGSRGAQYFFCNGRYIRSQLLQAAVEQAYRNTLLVGRFPACVIYLDINTSAVDVNVHPAKTEVKFSEEKKVFDAVYYAALGALEVPRVPDEPVVQASAPRVVSQEPSRQSWQITPPSSPSENRTVLHETPAHYQTRIEMPSYTPVYAPAQNDKTAPIVRPVEYAIPSYVPSAQTTVTQTANGVLTQEEESPIRLIGEALELYILVQKGEALILIDKHAAHERVIFDRLCKQESENMSQALLEPVPLSPTAHDAEMIDDNLELLNSLGFGLESYGERDFILRSAPAGLDPAEAAAALEEALEDLAGSKRLDKNAAREEILKTVSCKAAIKAGRSSEPEELMRLVHAVCSGEVRYCPHGRPVSWTLTRQDIDKQFKRIL